MNRYDEDAAAWTIRSEFATIVVRAATTTRGECLVVEDLKTGQSVTLDALELESLAWCKHEDLTPFINPATSRWTGTGA